MIRFTAVHSICKLSITFDIIVFIFSLFFPFIFRNSTDFSKLLGITFERLFMLCSDECDDIRIYSEECLNRLTHVSL